MQRINHANGVLTYTFDSLRDLPVSAHVSTRHGGVSPEPWATLNFSVLRGDSPERVQENRRRLAAALGIDAALMVRCQQVHGTGVAKADHSDAGRLIEGCDGLVTDSVGLPLSVVFADCTPILLYDRRRHLLGVCHAGWRGTINGAAAATIWALQAGYDSDPADIVACIGPAIGPGSYEVGDEVLDLAQARLPGAALFFSFPNGAGSRPYFNLWEANRSQLAAAGVPPDQIEVAGIDTATHTDDFFSHRAEQGRCGLFCMVAWLQEGI